MLILASESPRRKTLLTQLGVTFRVEAADVDESRIEDESPQAMCIRLALLKAQTVFERNADNEADLVEDKLAVLAGDTVVAIDDEMLGKPTTREHAVAMLQRLSGNTHCVFSAVALIAEGHREHRLSTTLVTFKQLSQAQVERYCDSTEPYDKAGAYAIQGAAGAFVIRVDGSRSGVVGLPLSETRQLLQQIDCGSVG